MRPVIFLAFANDPEAPLNGLSKEREDIREALHEAEKVGLCEVIEHVNVTLDDIIGVFQDKDYRGRIAMFHYGGHANGYQLLLESEEGKNVAARSEGLVPFFARQYSLELVFLDGCSSQQQALEMIEAGVPSVIGTSQSINDDIASRLAGRFYNGLGQGTGIETAWREAIDEVKMRKGTASMRDLFWDGKETVSQSEDKKTPTPDQFPWNIYFTVLWTKGF
jgi:hypothetical protein